MPPFFMSPCLHGSVLHASMLLYFHTSLPPCLGLYSTMVRSASDGYALIIALLVSGETMSDILYIDTSIALVKGHSARLCFLAPSYLYITDKCDRWHWSGLTASDVDGLAASHSGGYTTRSKNGACSETRARALTRMTTLERPHARTWPDEHGGLSKTDKIIACSQHNGI